MRNLKKILAAITVIAMLASMMVVPALAEGFKYEEEATILNELKLMQGMALEMRSTGFRGSFLHLKQLARRTRLRPCPMPKPLV